MPPFRRNRVRLCGPKNPRPLAINTTSRSTNWSRGLSPFVLGPIDLYGEFTSQNVENAWQFSKVYPEHVDRRENPTKAYWEWAKEGWADTYAHRYPMGKGRIPLYSLWDGEHLTYIEARKRIYCPLYSKAVEDTEAYRRLKALYSSSKEDLWLWDFDAYDHISLNVSFKYVLNCPTRKMGHAFVLAMMLENQRVWEREE